VERESRQLRVTLDRINKSRSGHLGIGIAIGDPKAPLLMATFADEPWRLRSGERAVRIKREQRDETTSILDQRHARRLLPSRGRAPPDEESMRYWTAEMERADPLLFGRVTYEMMESAWRQPATGTWPDWMNEWEIPFAETIDRAKKYVVSSTLSRVD
jgi:hypothetical protein